MKSQQEIKKIADKWAAHSRGVCAMAGVEMTDLARISESIKGAISESITPTTCEWDRDFDDNVFKTGCGQTWIFPYGDPKDNGAKFCPCCGGQINHHKSP
jgi:hypothetical protein